MAATRTRFAQALALSNGWVAVILLAIGAWQIPQYYIGQYDPLFAANHMPLSGIANHTIPVFLLIFVCCTALTLFHFPALRRPILIAAVATLVLALAYYLFWRERNLWATNDEDKIVWLVTGTYATLPVATASSALIVWRYIRWRLDKPE
ncbi:MAG: hypothetical protein JNM59_13780 [Hyphomonadaceae bacterium]|nr:hypothetical protein [Hyphomonadaceae bacterium]